MRLCLHLSGLLFLLGAAACSSATQDAGSGAPVRQPGSPEDIAAHVVADQSNRLASDVRILSVDAIDFGDSSLGCPQPGMAYIQVITPGYKVMAALDDQEFDVRIARGRGFICVPGDTPPR
jgi:hypothetical protein